MSVQLLAENMLTDAHFLSCGSQASGFWGQPTPATANAGKFRLLSQGDAADFSFTGTTNADGNVGKTTLLDTALGYAFGTDYFVGGQVAVGAETRSVTAFDSTNGTVTVSPAFSSRVMSGTAYTISVPFEDRDFRVALTGAGDAGDARFHWSHNGGTTWLSRDNPNQHNWKDGATIFNNVADNRCPIAQAADGSLVAFYNSAADNQVYCKRSTDGGITWGAAISVTASNRIPRAALTLSTGRIMVFMDKYQSYSDDHGLTWAAEMAMNIESTAGNIYACVELNSGVLIAVHRNTSNVICHTLSPDNGFTWTASTTVKSGSAGANATAAIVQAENGSLICAYAFLSGDYDIRCKISPDGGTTWGTEIIIHNASANNVYNPVLLKDINGMIFMACYDAGVTPKIVYSVSSDHGATWSAADDLYAISSSKYPTLALVDGHRILCGYAAGASAKFCHRGFWHFGGTSGYSAIEAVPQKLICGAELIWHGSGGVTADAWSFAREYDFNMENLIADSPSRPWRTAADNADYAVVLDLGTSARFYADGVAFFGCNVRQITFQMNATDSWGSPSVDEDIVFDLATGAVDDVDGNFIQDTSLLAGYADHELKGLYLRILVGGAAAGNTWKILDNVGTWIILDTTAATAIADADTFAIFGTKAAGTFTAGLYRYVRIWVTAQQTAENYYQIGYAALGRMVSLTQGHTRGFGRTRQANVDMLRTPAGGMIPIRGADPKNIFELTWPMAEGARVQLLSMLDMQRGQNMVLIPDSTDLLDIHLVKAVSDARQTQKYKDKYDVVLTLEEVL